MRTRSEWPDSADIAFEIAPEGECGDIADGGSSCRGEPDCQKSAARGPMYPADRQEQRRGGYEQRQKYRAFGETECKNQRHCQLKVCFDEFKHLIEKSFQGRGPDLSNLEPGTGPCGLSLRSEREDCVLFCLQDLRRSI